MDISLYGENDIPETEQIGKLAAELAEAQQKIRILEQEKNRLHLAFKDEPEEGDAELIRQGYLPTLERIPELCVTAEQKPASSEGVSEQPSDANTVLIEGDNISALFAMQHTHKGKIDVIYIDPPYNTGNKDFVYADKRTSVTEESDLDGVKNADGKTVVGRDNPYRHSKWLSFMKRRLFLARELLSETGVILISIDDNEQARLKVLMDEIFGEENFIANMIYDGGLKNNSRFISTGHDYILIYALNKANLIEKDISWRETKKGLDLIKAKAEQIKKEVQQKTLTLIEATREIRQWLKENQTELDKGLLAYSNVDDNGDLYSSGDLSAPGGNGPKYQVFHPVDGLPCKTPTRGWGLTRETMNEKINQGLILFGKTHETTPRFKRLLLDSDNDTQVVRSYFWAERSTANKQLQAILGKNSFDFPKHVDVIRRLIALVSKPNSTVLDFFAGSGTTAHAVAELNKEDGGNRQCILVTHNNEKGKNIARDITAERLKRVLTGQGWADGKTHEPLPGELHYYKLNLLEPGFESDLIDDIAPEYPNLVALERNFHTVLLEDGDDEFTVLKGDKGVAVVWKDPGVVDFSQETILELMRQVETDVQVEGLEKWLYLPTGDEYTAAMYESPGWHIVAYPAEYVRKFQDVRKRLIQNGMLPTTPVEDSEATQSVPGS